ncbi:MULTISPECIES: hypothetical protein [unclassified Duganella]|uniref:hypothetical protein n=1 Tax=unclassified Duganella TaxID=2636909 RepID=UPI0006FB5D98|nr:MULTISPECIES: hypothetical protein [unclassified Duganella]KQV59658.1 hypothetical protein ASD07_22780 [Duganella sp. Root336D2]KRB87140.1 hypothetical protein ASE26_06980 [Duganella sp. Root198D2]
MNKPIFALVLLVTCCAVQARLPAPTEEQKATAAAAKDKQGWTDKVAAYKLCLAQDRVAAHYFKTKGSVGKPSAALPACADPGPYVAQVVATKDVGVADSKPVPEAGKKK